MLRPEVGGVRASLWFPAKSRLDLCDRGFADSESLGIEQAFDLNPLDE